MLEPNRKFDKKRRVLRDPRNIVLLCLRGPENIMRIGAVATSISCHKAELKSLEQGDASQTRQPLLNNSWLMEPTAHSEQLDVLIRRRHVHIPH